MAKMKAYATFDDYYFGQKREHRAIIRELRDLVKKTAPKLVEAVKWGNGCWLKGKVPVAYVHADGAWVEFGFMLGSKLDDPAGLLLGKGRYVRHVDLCDPNELYERDLARFLRQAIAITPESFAELKAIAGREKAREKAKARRAPAKRARKAPARKRR